MSFAQRTFASGIYERDGISYLSPIRKSQKELITTLRQELGNIYFSYYFENESESGSNESNTKNTFPKTIDLFQGKIPGVHVYYSFFDISPETYEVELQTIDKRKFNPKLQCISYALSSLHHDNIVYFTEYEIDSLQCGYSNDQLLRKYFVETNNIEEALLVVYYKEHGQRWVHYARYLGQNETGRHIVRSKWGESPIILDHPIHKVAFNKIKKTLAEPIVVRFYKAKSH